MNTLNFWKYFESEERYINENDKGDYWKFLDTTIEELNSKDIYIGSIIKIIKKIQNKDLKEKMKQKLLNLILDNKLVLKENNLILDNELFDSEEINKIIFSVDFFNSLEESSKNLGYIDYSKFKNFIYIFLTISDQNMQIEMFNKLFETIKSYNDFQKVLVDALEIISQKNHVLYEELFNSWINDLPKYYLKYLKVNSDPNYLYNKSLEYKDLKIGIDPRISIGPEVETNFINSLDINMYNQKHFEQDFIVSSDATVSPGREIICEPFHDTKEDLAKFKAVLDTLSEMGYYYDDKLENASGQINLGLSYLDSAQAILNFYEIFCNCEKVLFYISNEKGQLSRQSLYQNSRVKAISEIIGKRIINEDITRNEVIDMFLTENEKKFEKYGIKGLSHKKNSVCMRGVCESDYRFEIRIPNGGVNYNTWIDNIRLYGKIMEVAKKIADALKKDYITEEEERLIKLKLDLEEPDLSDKDKLEILMDLLFDDEKIKQIYFDRYDSVIAKINTLSPNDFDYMKYKRQNFGMEPAFGDVDFSYQYQSKLFEPYKDDDNEKSR